MPIFDNFLNLRYHALTTKVSNLLKVPRNWHSVTVYVGFYIKPFTTNDDKKNGI